MTRTVREIIRDHLISGGFDGLYLPLGECGCLLSDLMPCENGWDCKPGYKVPGDEDADWCVGEEKEPDNGGSTQV